MISPQQDQVTNIEGFIFKTKQDGRLVGTGFSQQGISTFSNKFLWCYFYFHMSYNYQIYMAELTLDCRWWWRHDHEANIYGFIFDFISVSTTSYALRSASGWR